MYEKVNWQADKLLTPIRFNQMETQYDEVIGYWTANPFRLSTGVLLAEILSDAPTHANGRTYFNTTNNTLYVSNGTTWIDIMEVV